MTLGAGGTHLSRVMDRQTAKERKRGGSVKHQPRFNLQFAGWEKQDKSVSLVEQRLSLPLAEANSGAYFKPWSCDRAIMSS